MPTYSFQDVHASIVGPGGSFTLTNGEGAAEEAISFEPAEDKSIMTTGADGGIMHALVASRSGTVTFRLLKTNPLNAFLQRLFDYQTASSLTHGKNLITVRDVVRGDFNTMEEAACRAQPANSYAKDGNVIEWKFDGRWFSELGFGSPEIY